MKIALVTFSTDSRNMAGIITAPLYFNQMLNEYCNSEIVVLHEAGKHDVYPDKIRYLKEGESKSGVLNEYDFVIFMTPGYLIKKKDDDPDKIMYSDMLDDLKTPFGFVINEERDGQLYFHFNEFVNHPMYKLLLLNSEDMHYDFQYLLPKNGKWFEFNFAIPLINKDIIENAKNNISSNVLVNTQRWVPRKRIKELIDITPELSKEGIQTDIWGDRKVYFYYRDLINKNTQYWNDCGGFHPDELCNILKNKKYLYNFVYVARESKNRKMRGRLELVTIEGLKYGVLPVLCSQTTPSWVGSIGKSAIVLDKEDLDKLPKILSEISDDEWFERFTNFFKEVRMNIYSKYVSLTSEISELIVEGE